MTARTPAPVEFENSIEQIRALAVIFRDDPALHLLGQSVAEAYLVQGIMVLLDAIEGKAPFELCRVALREMAP